MQLPHSEAHRQLLLFKIWPCHRLSDPLPTPTYFKFCRQYDEYIANVDIRTEYIDDKSNHQRVVYKFRCGVRASHAACMRSTSQRRLSRSRIITASSLTPTCFQPPPPRPYVFEGIDNIEIKNASLMPQRVVDDIIKSCLPGHAYKVEIGLMDKVREKIEKW